MLRYRVSILPNEFYQVLATARHCQVQFSTFEDIEVQTNYGWLERDTNEQFGYDYYFSALCSNYIELSNAFQALLDNA